MAFCGEFDELVWPDALTELIGRLLSQPVNADIEGVWAVKEDSSGAILSIIVLSCNSCRILWICSGVAGSVGFGF